MKANILLALNIFGLISFMVAAFVFSGAAAGLMH